MVDITCFRFEKHVFFALMCLSDMLSADNFVSLESDFLSCEISVGIKWKSIQFSQ